MKCWSQTEQREMHFFSSTANLLWSHPQWKWVSPDSENISAIVNCKSPINVVEVRSFLGPVCSDIYPTLWQGQWDTSTTHEKRCRMEVVRDRRKRSEQPKGSIDESWSYDLLWSKQRNQCPRGREPCRIRCSSNTKWKSTVLCQPRPHRCRAAMFADCWQCWPSYMLLKIFISISMGRGSSLPLTIDHFSGLWRASSEPCPELSAGTSASCHTSITRYTSLGKTT